MGTYPPPDTSDAWLGEFDRLFNKRKFKEAAAFLYMLPGLHGHANVRDDARWWIKLAMCRLIMGETPEETDETFVNAARCSNFVPSMGDPYQRDVVIWHIRHSNDIAFTRMLLAELVDRRPYGDHNMDACYTMLRGRLRAKEESMRVNGNMQAALAHFRYANLLWCREEHDEHGTPIWVPKEGSNTVWVQNNYWWWYVTWIRYKGVFGAPNAERKRLYDHVMQDPAWTRRQTARVLSVVGWPATNWVGF